MPLTTTGVLPKAAVMAPAKMYAPRKFRLGKNPSLTLHPPLFRRISPRSSFAPNTPISPRLFTQYP